MLKKCPECGLPVSDRALFCPHCGDVLKPESKQSSLAKISRRRRLPNGFGQISKIKGENLRKPYRVMVSVGTNEKGRPICKTLKPQAYFRTYNDAYEALMKYNSHPYDLLHIVTLKELYDLWFEDYRDHSKNIKEYYLVTHPFSLMEPLFGENVKALEPVILKTFIEKLDTKTNWKKRIKIILNMMFDYAVMNGYTEKNPARRFRLSRDIMNDSAEYAEHHRNFTEEEWNILWKNKDSNDYIKMILIESCMGWRPIELLGIEMKNVDIENWTMVGGVKTEAGRNRIVPIHERIRPLVKEWYDRAKEANFSYLFFTNEKNGVPMKITYESYRYRFNCVMKNLGFEQGHKPHDCRVEFVSKCKQFGVDVFAIKYRVGHVITDITESIYTKRNPNWLSSELSKVEF